MEVVIKAFDELTGKEVFDIARARMSVFALEQGVRVEDLDDKDKFCHHVYIKENEEIAAYCRIVPKGLMEDEIALSRVITTKKYRGKHYGEVLMNASLDFIKNELKADMIKIPSQVRAAGFYEKFGFYTVGERFIVADIEHIRMIKKL
ncbi:MAG: GNAT family N-acetyltransferase [Sarcina sp.]